MIIVMNIMVTMILYTSGFTCLDNIINSQILCRSISGFECISCRNILGFDGIYVTIGISL